MNALVLNLTALQANPDSSNFEYQNISNMSYFLYFLSFSNESIQAVRAGNIFNRYEAHIPNQDFSLGGAVILLTAPERV